MRESYWGYWIVILGVFVLMIMLLISNVTTTNTQDYYLIKEVTEQSMVDSVDLAYYRLTNELKINREKFIESFLRRFSENVALNTYQIDFYGIYEAPPKVSVKVTTKSASYNIGMSNDSFDIINKVDAILELDGVTKDSGLQDNSVGGSKTSDTNSTGSTVDLGNFEVSEKKLDEIVEQLKEDFYEKTGTSANSSGKQETNYKKKNESKFVEQALKHFENLKGSSLSTSERSEIESLVRSAYPKYEDTYRKVTVSSNDDDDDDYYDDDYDDEEEDDFEPSMELLKRIYYANREDFYDGQGAYYNEDKDATMNRYTKKSYKDFLQVALDYFYYEKNDDLNKFETAQVEDFVSQFYDTVPNSYEEEI